MKKVKIYLLAGIAILFNACGDGFLDVEPNKQTEENFYKTTDDAWKALVGCYDGLQTVWADGVSFPVASEVFSDNAFGGTGSSDDLKYQMLDEFDKSRSPSTAQVFDANWKAYYAAMLRCNMLISKEDQIEWGSNETLRKTYMSEARFIRAYLYFDMVRLWGNIPLLTAPTTDNIPQAAADDVYQLIAEDLTYACENMPAKPWSASDVATNGGRVTKYAAEALMARVFLYYTGYYGKTDLAGVQQSTVLGYLEDVIANGNYGLVENFANLWPVSSVVKNEEEDNVNGKVNYVGEDNKETVFAIKYTWTSDYNGNTDGNHWMIMTGIRSFDVYPYAQGWGACPVDPKLWSAFKSGDTRQAVSIASIKDEGLKLSAKQIQDQREYTGYYIKKYMPMSMYNDKGELQDAAIINGAVNNMLGQYQDYVSIRYADVLLMAAELGSPNAQNYMDMIMERAFGDSFTQVYATKANILEQRRLEFVGEGIRYWDLLRQGVDVAAQAIATTTEVQNGGVKTTKSIAADKIRTTKGLQQIPQSEIDLSNGVLVQNTGW